MIHNTTPLTIDINGRRVFATLRDDLTLNVGCSTIFKPSEITIGHSDPFMVGKSWIARYLDMWRNNYRCPVYNILPNGKYIFDIK